MLEDILLLERDLFLSLNNWHTPLLDTVLWVYSKWVFWLPFFAAFLFALIYKKPIRDWLPVVVALVVVAASSVLVSDVLLKPYFARLRPTYHPDFMDSVKYVFNYKGEGLYGFISGHATFSFAFATFTTLLLRIKWWGIAVFGWAIVMAYSRIYLGVHFLSDVVAGALAGAVIGGGVFWVYRRFA